MSTQIGIPKGATIAINDLLDNCAKIKPGQELLLLAHIDGLYGRDNLVHDHGHLTALDSPAVLAVAQQYPININKSNITRR